MKMRTAHIVPLARQALEVLERWRDFTGSNEWLFPVSFCSSGRWSSTLRRLCARQRCTGWPAPKTALIAGLSAFEPAMMKSRH
jgi:integrase